MSRINCLLCGVDCLEGNNVKEGRKLWNLFNKILKVPYSWCVENLDGDWCFCGGCSAIVDNGLAIMAQMDQLSAKLRGVGFNMLHLLGETGEKEEEEKGWTQQGGQGLGGGGDYEGQDERRSVLIKEMRKHFGGWVLRRMEMDLEEDDVATSGIGIISGTMSLLPPLPLPLPLPPKEVQVEGIEPTIISITLVPSTPNAGENVGEDTKMTQNGLADGGEYPPPDGQGQGEIDGDDNVGDEDLELQYDINPSMSEYEDEYEDEDEDDEGMEGCVIDDRLKTDGHEKGRIVGNETEQKKEENSSLVPNSRRVTLPSKLDDFILDDEEHADGDQGNKEGDQKQEDGLVACSLKETESEQQDNSSFSRSTTSRRVKVPSKLDDFILDDEEHEEGEQDGVVACSLKETEHQENSPSSSLNPNSRRVKVPSKLDNQNDEDVLKKRKYKLKGRYSTKKRNYYCLLCDANCGHGVNLGKHYSTIHGSPTVWDCFECGKIFDKKLNLYIHRRDIHKNLPINEHIERKVIRGGQQDVSTTRRVKVPSKLDDQEHAGEGDQGHEEDRGTCSLEDATKRQENSSLVSTSRRVKVPSKLADFILDDQENEDYQEHEEGEVDVSLVETEQQENSPVNCSSRKARVPSKLNINQEDENVLKKKKYSLKRRHSTKRNYFCLLCDADCDNGVNLGQHYSTIHGSPTVWDCFECAKRFDKRDNLYIHRRRIHKNLPINENIEEEVIKKTKQKAPTSTKTLAETQKCPPPPIPKSAKKSSLLRHFVCVVCDKVFPTVVSLGHHFATDHGTLSSWPCSECGMEFKEKTQLYYHKRDLHKNVPINRDSHPLYGITNQETSFVPYPHPQEPVGEDAGEDAANIGGGGGQLLHMKSAKRVQKTKGPAKRRSYACLLCDATFKNPHQIGTHYKQEHPDPEWKCRICDKICTSKTALFQHRTLKHSNLPTSHEMKKKTDLQKGTGSIRGGMLKVKKLKGGTSSSSMNILKKQRKKWNYKCVICQEDCKSSYGVVLHYKTAHPTLPKCLKCSECRKVFNSYNTLLDIKEFIIRLQMMLKIWQGGVVVMNEC